MLRHELLEGIKKTGYLYPNQMQAQGILNALKGEDFLCQARAGTGKTAIFVIAILNQL